MCMQLDQTVVNIHSALVMDAAVPGPSKVLALLSSLGIVLRTHAIAIWNYLPILFRLLALLVLNFLKYHIFNMPCLYLFPLLFKVYMCLYMKSHKSNL